MSQHVVVADHPGFADRFEVDTLEGFHGISAAGDVEPVTVVITEVGEILVVRSRHVFTPEGLRYAEEWATKTRKSIFDIRVPDALAVNR